MTHEGSAERALVLLSGGLDSAVSLYWSLSRGWDVATIEFEYHLRPERESRACRELRERAGIRESVVVPLGFVREASDLPPERVLNSELRKSPEGYIPARNLLFYALAAHYAEPGGRRYIVGGHNRTDSVSFPDAGRDFFNHLNALLKLAVWSHSTTGTEIVLPLIEMDKTQVIRMGRDLQVPFELTWSCYFDGDAPCGTCESCVERREAFSAAGVETSIDPLIGDQADQASRN